MVQHGDDEAVQHGDDEAAAAQRRARSLRRGRAAAWITAVALALLGYDAGTDAAAVHRALHDGVPGVVTVTGCVPAGCTGRFVPDDGGSPRRTVPLDPGTPVGHRIRAVFYAGHAVPQARSGWIYPGAVACCCVLGLLGLTGVALGRRRRRCHRPGERTPSPAASATGPAEACAPSDPGGSTRRAGGPQRAVTPPDT